MEKKQDGVHLEVVAGSSKGSQNTHVERRRLARLNLAQEQFRDQRLSKIFPVVDLSVSGMALRILERVDLQHFPVAAEVPGILNLRGNKYGVKARVRHIGADLVGLEFEGLPEATLTEISKFLDPVALGQELRPIPASEQGAIWYRGPSGTHLILWRNPDGQYRKLALFVLGYCIQWDDEDGLFTGKALHSDEEGEVRGIFRYETMLLEKDEVPDSEKLEIARQVIQNSILQPELRKWCIRHLQKVGGVS